MGWSIINHSIVLQFCMLCSAGYHVFSCHSEDAYKRWLGLDLAGISIGILGCYISAVYYAFGCYPVKLTSISIVRTGLEFLLENPSYQMACSSDVLMDQNSVKKSRIKRKNFLTQFSMHFIWFGFKQRQIYRNETTDLRITIKPYGGSLSVLSYRLCDIAATGITFNSCFSKRYLLSRIICLTDL